MAGRTRIGFTLLALAGAACTSPPGLDVSERAQPTRIEHVARVVHVASQSPLRPADAAALRRAVSLFGPPEAVHASVGLPAGAAGATRSALRRELVFAGVPPTNVVFVASGAPGAEVTLHRYVAVPPECGAYALDLNRSTQENPRSNLGCNNQRNLTLMVDDPRDLIRGRTIGPADSEHAGGAVDRYRGDEVKELLKPERLTTR